MKSDHPLLVSIKKILTVGDQCLSRYLHLILLMIILWNGYQLRQQFLITQEAWPLEKDAQGYYQLAVTAKNFYDASFREPFFIWSSKLSLALFGKSAVTLRWQSLLWGVVLIAMTYALGAAFSPLVGLGAAFMVSVNRFMIESSSRALRMEFYISFFLLFIYFLFQNQWQQRLRLIICTLLGSCLALTRITSLNLLILMYLYFWWMQPGKLFNRQRLKLGLMLLVSLLVILLTIFPFLYNCHKQYGDAFYSINMVATYLRNQEFIDQPGFLTQEQVRQNPYGGPKITTREYIFSLHTIPEIYQRYVSGYLAAFLVYIPNGTETYALVTHLGWIGLLLLLFIPEKRYLSVSLIILLFPNAFILLIDAFGHKGQDLRFAYAIFPLYTICMMWCGQCLLLRYKKILGFNNNKEDNQ